MEQDYGKQKRWLVNRLTLGSGALDGLSVAPGDTQLRVTAGVAVDGLGREIVVPETVTVDLCEPPPPCLYMALDPRHGGAVTVWQTRWHSRSLHRHHRLCQINRKTLVP